MVPLLANVTFNMLVSFPKLIRRLGGFDDASDSELIIDFSPDVELQSLT